jgi:DHA1 family multidrug resistance protein-like MFS transporter
MITPPPLPSLSPTPVFAGLCLVGFFARLSYALARTPVLALFAAFLGAGPEAIGFAVAISTITGIFFKMPAGVVSDVIGKIRTLYLGLAFFALVPFAYLLVDSYPSLVVVRFFHGFATAIYGPVAMALVADLMEARRAEMLSWFSAVTITGNLLGAPLGGFLLTYLSTQGQPELRYFHIVYGVVAILGMVSFGAALWILRGRQEPAKTGEGRTLAVVWEKFRRGIRELLMDPKILLTSNMEGVQNLAMGALEAFLPIYAVVICGFSAFQAGLLWGVQIVATIMAKPIMGTISDRYGRQPLIFWGMFACALPLALIPWIRSYPVLLVLAAVFGLGEAVVTSSAAALVADFCQREHLGAAMGTFGTIFDVGHAAGPLLAGALISLWGGQDYRGPFAIIAALLILSALVFRKIVPRQEKTTTKVS